MLTEQYNIAEDTMKFIQNYGLLKQFVAKKCDIDRSKFSSWLNHKTVIKQSQVQTVQKFMKEYHERMD